MAIFLKRILPLLFVIFLIREIANGSSNGVAGKSSSPGEGNCTSCHSSYAVNSGVGSTTITTNIPGSGYVLGQTYNITVTVAQSGFPLFGFDFEALNTSNTDAGTLTITDAASTQKLTSGGKTNITHTNNGGLVANSKSFNFSWTAPLTDIGNITFYTSGNAANNNRNDIGDYIYTKSAVFSAAAGASITTGTISGSPFCAGQTGVSIPYTISGAYNAGNVFTAQLSSATGSFTTPTTLGSVTSTAAGTITTTVPLPATAGTQYRIRVVSSTPVITGADNGTNLTINLNPTVSSAGADQSICGTTATLAGNTPTVGAGTWTLLSGTGTITTPSSPTSGITVLGVGQNKFIWTISNGSCVSRDTVVITATAAPTPAIAGADQSVCGTTATLAGNTATVGTGIWSLISGSGTITSPSSPTSGVTVLGVGQNKFVWTISNSSCVSRDTVIITATAIPTVANAGVDQSVCGTSATLAGNAPTIGTGIWTLLNGTGTITNPSSPTSGITVLGVGQNKFIWTISNGSCISRDTVSITGVAPPTVANAGIDQTACSNTATLFGNTPTVGTGTWTLLSGTGTITSPTSPTSGITGLGVGQNKFIWTISNSPCPSSSDTVLITQSGTITAAIAGVDQSVCSTTATLAGNAPTVGTGSWSLVFGSGAITTPSSPSSGIAGLGIGQNKFVWTIANPPCTPSTDTVIITRAAAPTVANAGVDQTVCGTTAVLAGNLPTVGTGVWILVSGSGTINIPSSPTSGVTGLGVGQNKFIWTISNSPCTSSNDTVVIIQSGSITTANAGADQTVCGTSATLAGNTPVSGTGVWTLASGSGTITIPSSPASGVTGLGVGQNKFVWTISNSPCISSSDTVIITRTATPTVANAGVDQTVCGTTAVLAGNTPTVGTGIWILLSGSGTISSSSSPTSSVSGLGVGQNKFVWTISNSPCTSSKDSVVITSNICSPTISTSASVSAGPYCQNTSYSMTVAYTTTGTLTGPFLVQLSDTSGSFNSPLTIGYGTSSPINVTLPSGLARGTHYRIRVISNNDGVTGNDNGSDISINTCALTAIVNNVNARIQLYPNPNKGQFVIVPDKSGEATVSIMGIMGNEVYCVTSRLQKGQAFEIHAEDLARGVYVLKVNFGEDNFLGSFIKE